MWEKLTTSIIILRLLIGMINLIIGSILVNRIKPINIINNDILIWTILIIVASIIKIIASILQIFMSKIANFMVCICRDNNKCDLKKIYIRIDYYIIGLFHILSLWGIIIFIKGFNKVIINNNDVIYNNSISIDDLIYEKINIISWSLFNILFWMNLTLTLATTCMIC